MDLPEDDSGLFGLQNRCVTNYTISPCLIVFYFVYRKVLRRIFKLLIGFNEPIKKPL